MDDYNAAFQEFIQSGDLLQLTYNFPDVTKTKQDLPWSNCTACLLDVGVVLIKPRLERENIKNVVISSGVHGNETAPIEIVNAICKNIAVSGIDVNQNLLLIIGNPPAMVEGKRFIVENLNRLFSLDSPPKSQNIETERAGKLMAIVADFFGPKKNYHYDLHTAIRPSSHEKFAIYPYQENGDWSLEQLSFLSLSGINTVLFSHAPAKTFSYHSSFQYNAHAFTLELGQVKKFGQNDMTKFDQILTSLQSLIEDKVSQNEQYQHDNFLLYSVCHEVINTSAEFKFYIDQSVHNFTTFPVGTLIWEDKENSYKTIAEGEAIVFPNPLVPIGQRVALMIKPSLLDNT